MKNKLTITGCSSGTWTSQSLYLIEVALLVLKMPLRTENRGSDATFSEAACCTWWRGQSRPTLSTRQLKLEVSTEPTPSQVVIMCFDRNFTTCCRQRRPKSFVCLSCRCQMQTDKRLANGGVAYFLFRWLCDELLFVLLAVLLEYSLCFQQELTDLILSSNWMVQAKWFFLTCDFEMYVLPSNILWFIAHHHFIFMQFCCAFDVCYRFMPI